MTTEEKIKLITRNLEEVLTEEELKKLIESGTPLKHYIGYEISGKLHIGHFFTLLKVKDMQDAGADTIIWMADLHSAINDKLDGNLETISRLAKEYFEQTMKVLFKSIGGDPEKLDFQLTSETYAKNPSIWQTLLEIGKNTSLSRIMRSITIMGREEADGIDSAKIMYPLMQAADIFLLQVNIAQAGLDQRKVHVIAIDSANQVKTNAIKDKNGKTIKPIAIHTPILLGLTPPEAVSENLSDDEIAMKTKMSKSKADSGVSVHETPEDIRAKINKAFAPEGETENNPILNWTKHLIFYYPDSKLEIKRDEKFGGNVTYNSYEDLEKDYQDKKLHPMDLKNAVAEWLIKTMEPVRTFFEDPKRKASLEEIESLASRA
ncbi:MAG: tyrosine--tRNA ligase [Candidatus Daviesbacteria bacterium]|nr:tyrosine--tRNA ligase [Candidatus Daviesbacteria bacterium]